MGPSKVDVSVVMPVYNGERHITDAVNSILRQAYRDFEFIIVNDGSDDGTLRILENIQDDRIILMSQENIGLTASLNKAIRIAKGAYIARQDADDLSEPNRLERQIEYLRRHRNIALVGSWCSQIDEDGEEIGRIQLLTDPHDIGRALPYENQFVHGSIMARTEALISVGLYREAFKFAQDYDLVLRMGERFELANIPESLYSHRHNSSMLSARYHHLQLAYSKLAQDMWKQRRRDGVDAVDRGVDVSGLLDVAEENDVLTYHRHMVYACLRSGKLTKARRAVKVLIEKEPFKFKHYGQLLLTFAGGVAVKRLLRYWDRVRYGSVFEKL